MTKAGLIFGSNVLFDTSKLKEKTVSTEYGDVELYEHKDLLVTCRHGKNANIPPHKINYRAIIAAFAKENIKSIIGVSSVGSLKKNIKPGSIVTPYDYINLGDIPTFFDDEIRHVLPELDENLRKSILVAAERLRIDVFEGIYFQTKGPRLETKAEISVMKQFADVVGMTMASEATLARELGLRYASICSVDNYANGITDEKLDFDVVKKRAKQNSAKIKSVISEVFGLK